MTTVDFLRAAQQNVAFAQPETPAFSFDGIMFGDQNAFHRQLKREVTVPASTQLLVLSASQAGLVGLRRRPAGQHQHGKQRGEPRDEPNSGSGISPRQ